MNRSSRVAAAGNPPARRRRAGAQIAQGEVRAEGDARREGLLEERELAAGVATPRDERVEGDEARDVRRASGRVGRGRGRGGGGEEKKLPMTPRRDGGAGGGSAGGLGGGAAASARGRRSAPERPRGSASSGGRPSAPVRVRREESGWEQNDESRGADTWTDGQDYARQVFVSRHLRPFNPARAGHSDARPTFRDLAGPTRAPPFASERSRRAPSDRATCPRAPLSSRVSAASARPSPRLLGDPARAPSRRAPRRSRW